jgi:probable phosphoglycerate mutase
MTSIVLIRHAAYREGPQQGSAGDVDLGLTDEGLQQARALAASFNGGTKGTNQRLTAKSLRPDLLISSTERRALETADIVGRALDLPIVRDSEFIEWRADDGTLEDSVFMDQWTALSPDQRRYHRFSPNGETGMEFQVRIQSGLNRITEAHAGKIIAVMTHGGVIQAAFQHFFGFGEAAFRRAYPVSGYTSKTHWRYHSSANRWSLESSNDLSHLSA